MKKKEDRVIYRFEKEDKGFQITRDPDGAYVLLGEKIEKLFKMTDMTREESIQRFSRQLRGMGLMKHCVNEAQKTVIQFVYLIMNLSLWNNRQDICCTV